MKKSVITAAFLLGVSSISLVTAQELQLKTAVEESLKYSPVIQRSLANVDDAHWKKIESYTGFLPSVSGDINYLFDKKYAFIDVDINGSPASFPQIIPTSQFILTASMPIFDGLANVNRYQAGSRLYDSAQNDYEWTEFTVSMQTTLLFYRTLVAKNLMDVAYQNEHTIEDHYNDIKALLRAGIATKFDVLRVEVQMNEAAAEVLRTQDEFEFAKIRLAKAMGKDEDNRVPTGEFPSLSASMIDKFDVKSNNRQDLTALSQQTQASLNAQKAAGRFWVPRISIFGQAQEYNNVNDTFTDWDAYRDAYQVGVNLHWNIFDGTTSLAKAKQAKAEQIISQNNLRSASLKAGEDVEVWKRKFLYFCKLVDVKNTQAEKAQEAVRLAKESVRAGTKTNTDLLDAELDLFKSRSDVLNVRMGMVEALINFELATGQRFYNFQS